MLCSKPKTVYSIIYRRRNKISKIQEEKQLVNDGGGSLKKKI